MHKKKSMCKITKITPRERKNWSIINRINSWEDVRQESTAKMRTSVHGNKESRSSQEKNSLNLVRYSLGLKRGGEFRMGRMTCEIRRAVKTNSHFLNEMRMFREVSKIIRSHDLYCFRLLVNICQSRSQSLDLDEIRPFIPWWITKYLLYLKTLDL
jgi:hypothetical protein